MSDVLLDARELLPPEPMLRVLAALPTLAPGEALTLLLYREPFPLYALLQERGFTWRTSLADDGTYTIVITHRP
jgi:uncharacterized protein (DUF2249 family)